MDDFLYFMLSFHPLILVGFEVVAGLNGNIDIHLLAALSRSLCGVCVWALVGCSGALRQCIAED